MRGRVLLVAAQGRARRAVRACAADLQEHDLPKRALSICGVLEGIKNLFERHDLSRALLLRPPHDAVGALPKLLYDIVLPRHVAVDILRHRVRGGELASGRGCSRRNWRRQEMATVGGVAPTPAASISALAQ